MQPLSQMIGRAGFSARNVVWFAIGTVALALGIIGVVLPLLPTTPFVILAALAFGKSAPRFQKRLQNNAIFGPMITDWNSSGAIAPKYKLMAVSMMAIALLLAVMMGFATAVLIVQAICLLAAAAFVLSRPNGRA
ncbi:MAG: YbaN family protein [Cypionkella sp.]